MWNLLFLGALLQSHLQLCGLYDSATFTITNQFAETESGVISQILHEELSFECDPWPSISESAKDLVKKMLERDPKKRISAHEVLCEFLALVQQAKEF